MSKKKEPTFEEALEELEEITRNLESGSLTLDDSIRSYEKGMELKKICSEILKKAEKKLEYIEKNEKGEILTRSLEAGASEGVEGLFGQEDDS